MTKFFFLPQKTDAQLYKMPMRRLEVNEFFLRHIIGSKINKDSFQSTRRLPDRRYSFGGVARVNGKCFPVVIYPVRCILGVWVMRLIPYMETPARSAGCNRPLLDLLRMAEVSKQRIQAFPLMNKVMYKDTSKHTRVTANEKLNKITLKSQQIKIKVK